MESVLNCLVRLSVCTYENSRTVEWTSIKFDTGECYKKFCYCCSIGYNLANVMVTLRERHMHLFAHLRRI
jgi:hypothetical protein